MQTSNKPYALPPCCYISIVRRGKLICRFDHIRGVLEIQSRGEMETVDLAAEIERHEQKQTQANSL